MGLYLGRNEYCDSLNFAHRSLVIDETESFSLTAFGYNVPNSLYWSLPIYFNHLRINFMGTLRRTNFRHYIINSLMEVTIVESIS